VLGAVTAVPPGAGALLLASCGAPGSPSGAKPAATPGEITWSTYQLGAAREKPWNDTFAMAEKATGVKINVVWEPGQEFATLVGAAFG
jgi:ABC-type glycerol-3-phosphate transport system substrate-binding protein